MSLMITTLLSSAVAAVGGIFAGLSGPQTGGIALLPGVFALIATTLKPQERANWHYRKRDALEALRRRLLFQLPEAPSADNVAAIAADWTKVDNSMNEEWEKTFALDWSALTKPAEPKAGP